jgi:SAM-dependent methyltransferase
MNLAELVLLSNRLEKLTVADLQQDALIKFDRIMHESDLPQESMTVNFRSNLSELNNTIQTSFTNFEIELKRYKDEVRRLIYREGVKWFYRASVKYEGRLGARFGQQPDAINFYQNQPIPLDDKTTKIFKSRVQYYADWRYPAMIIHPMTESFIHDMVSNDPLYLVDESQYLLEPSLTHWNDTYKNRLRLYHIEESFDQPILNKLPNGQFGICLVYNYLNYRPYEIIKKYLAELYEKLRPGGVLAMTFNDCDRYQSIQMVEQDITCYTPGSLVLGYAEYIGFEKVYEYRDDSASVWIELKKPGTLTSLRGGQALAKIKPKPVA